MCATQGYKVASEFPPLDVSRTWKVSRNSKLNASVLDRLANSLLHRLKRGLLEGLTTSSNLVLVWPDPRVIVSRISVAPTWELLSCT